MISTRSLAPLPNIPILRRLSQSLAMMDALLEPEWSSRYYSFDARWSVGQMLASMRDGSGDDYFIVFDEQAGAVIKGYAHESAMARYSVDTGAAWPGTLDRTPDTFKELLADPAFSIEDTTFCIWRAHADAQWSIGDIAFPAGEDPDGSRDLLHLLDGRPAAYKRWAEEYYETQVPLKLARHVYNHLPLSVSIQSEFQVERTYEEITADALEIGYPCEP